MHALANPLEGGSLASGLVPGLICSDLLKGIIKDVECLVSLIEGICYLIGWWFRFSLRWVDSAMTLVAMVRGCLGLASR